MADRWRLTCSCGLWRGFTETDVDAHRLAAEHEREKGTHVVKVESRDDYCRRGWPRDRSIRARYSSLPGPHVET
jgi:hypothetical protein